MMMGRKVPLSGELFSIKGGAFQKKARIDPVELLQQFRQFRVTSSMIRFVVCLLLVGFLHAAPPYPPEIEDARMEVYRTVDEVEMKLWIFGKKIEGQSKPAILFFFGGGWNAGSPVQFESQARHFAERGMIAMLVDYRVKSRHGVSAIECVKDGKAALAWARENADKLGVDPKRIATAGGSAGGHVAASIGTLTGLGSDERPNAMILFNPAATLGDLGDWKAHRVIATARLGVKKSEDLSPSHHIGKHTPPTLIMHGSKDTTVPIGSVEAYDKQMKKLGRLCKLIRYEGAAHGFFNRGKHQEQTLKEADDFLVELGWLPKS